MGENKKAVVFTLGCKVNECESDSIIAELSERGYDVSDTLEVADIYVVNTCAVTKEAEKKSRQTVSRIKRLNPHAKIIFTGCASEKCPSAFSKKGENYLVTGVFGKGRIPDMLNSCGENLLPHDKVYEDLHFVKSLKTRTFIKVQDGCDNFCSYCVIPYLRGRSRSRNPEKIIEEINGVNSEEVVITGINLSDYNYNGITLTGLMERLTGVNKRIRLGSLEVGVIDERFLETLKNLKNFAPHFHLSLQSGSDFILKKMNRKYTRKEFIEKSALIKKYFVNAGITTDIIVGFPYEREEDYLDTLSIISEVGFTDIHPFIFSPREGTVAYKMPDVDKTVKKQRLDILMERKSECKKNFVKSQIGKTLEFLPEDTENGYTVGYSENYLRIYVKGNTDKHLQKVLITEEFADGVIAKPL